MDQWINGLAEVVNEAKTELCLFYSKDTPMVELQLNKSIIHSKIQVNVLYVIFDSKLQHYVFSRMHVSQIHQS